MLQRMRQPFGLIRRPDRHRRGRFCGVRPRRRANARCRRIQGDHARPWRRPEIDGLAPAAALDKVQGRAGNRERREHDHQQSKSVIDASNCRHRWLWVGLCLLPTLLPLARWTDVALLSALGAGWFGTATGGSISLSGAVLPDAAADTAPCGCVGVASFCWVTGRTKEIGSGNFCTLSQGMGAVAGAAFS